MTVHSYHPPSHTHGLDDDCERCAQLARNPGALDSENRARLLAGKVYTERDRQAKEALEAEPNYQRP